MARPADRVVGPGRPRQVTEGWGAVGHPEWGKFKLGKTNPNYSTSGLNATIASYFAATGLSSDLTLEERGQPATRDFVKDLESSVVHYGDTTLTFLENMANEAAAGKGLTYVSAVTVEEKSVLDYNQGNPTGDPATAGQSRHHGSHSSRSTRRTGPCVSDNPWIILDAPWVDAAKAQAGNDFLAWLKQPSQQSRSRMLASAPSRASLVRSSTRATACCPPVRPTCSPRPPLPC